MKTNIEKEIDKTLECFNESIDIQVSPLFADNLSGKIADIRFSHRIGYPGRMFYPVVIILLLTLNFSAVMTSLKGHRQIDVSNVQSNVLAGEYGIGQNSYNLF